MLFRNNMLANIRNWCLMKINKKLKREGSADTMYSRMTSKKKAKSPQDDGESIMKKLELDQDEKISSDQEDRSDIYLKQIYDTMMADNREKKMGLDRWSKHKKKG